MNRGDPTPDPHVDRTATALDALVADTRQRVGIGYCLVFGVLWPPLMFWLDPLFFTPAGLRIAPPEMRLGSPGSPEAHATYALLAAMCVGMFAHLATETIWARPLLLIGVVFSAFFSLAILPVAPMAIALLPAPFVLSPFLCLVAYVSALRANLYGAPRSHWLPTLGVAALIVCLAGYPVHRVTRVERELRGASTASAQVRALETLVAYDDIERLRDVYRDSGPRARMRLRALYRELTGQPLLPEFRNSELAW